MFLKKLITGFGYDGHIAVSCDPLALFGGHVSESGVERHSVRFASAVDFRHGFIVW
jgi:hypothetical protein